jgi:DNA repair ATPase RecN
MWLKKLILNNFQKHEHLELDFTPGVNILYGHSDAGKSCIRRAIGFVFFGDPCADDIIRKEDTKQTSVSVLLDNGSKVERVKSASINRYVVNVPGQAELTFDSIGAKIPEEVQQVLQLQNVEIDKLTLNLNIAEQVCLPFLNGPEFPATARFKLFNKLTGNDLLDVAQGNINKEILGINRELKNVKDIITVNEPQADKLTKEINEKSLIRTSILEKRKIINDQVTRYARLKELALKIAQNRESLAKTQTIEIKAPELNGEALRGLIKRVETLYKIQRSLLEVQSTLSDTKTQLKGVKAPILEVAVIRARIERITRLLLISTKLVDNGAKIKKSFGEWNTLQGLIPNQEKEYAGILQEAKICPVCKQDTSKCEVHL